MNANSAEHFLFTLQNLRKALSALETAVATPITEQRDLSGIVKDFEIVYELSWKALKKYLEVHGHEVKTAKHAFSIAYQLGLIEQEEVWLEMINDRNLTVHTYNENFALELSERIRLNYLQAFQRLEKNILVPRF